VAGIIRPGRRWWRVGKVIGRVICCSVRLGVLNARVAGGIENRCVCGSGIRQAAVLCEGVACDYCYVVQVKRRIGSRRPSRIVGRRCVKSAVSVVYDVIGICAVAEVDVAGMVQCIPCVTRSV